MIIEQIRPQPKQEQFLSSPADIVIYGGGAGGGKTWSILVEPLRYKDIKNFGAVIFRRTVPEITREGGMWHEALEMYPRLGARPNAGLRTFDFGGLSRITFAHMQLEKTKYAFRGAQIALIEFDQLETFTEMQWWYMFSRNRSKCGVLPYIRATANPEPGWLADLLAWWIDKDGWAIPERSGIIRYMARDGNNIVWGKTAREIINRYPHDALEPKSFTFILSTLEDNKILTEHDPGYAGRLKMLPHVERMRLLGDGVHLGGNWKIRPSAGNVFHRDWFLIKERCPFDASRSIRYWDLAGTEAKEGTDPDWSASVKMLEGDGQFCIVNAKRARVREKQLEEILKATAMADGHETEIWIEQEGGSGSKNYLAYLAREVLTGYVVHMQPAKHDKVMRAKPLSSAAENGNVFLIAADWNDDFIEELHNFPEGRHDDWVDSGSGAHNALVTPEDQETIITYEERVDISPF